MASSSFKDAPSPDEANPDKAVTIVIGEDGDLNYDEKTLQSIIGQILFIVSINKNHLSHCLEPEEQGLWRLYSSSNHCQNRYSWRLTLLRLIRNVLLEKLFLDSLVFSFATTSAMRLFKDVIEWFRQSLVLCFVPYQRSCEVSRAPDNSFTTHSQYSF